MKNYSRLIEGGLLILFFLSPLFYGSVEIWSQSIMQLLIIFIFLIWMIKMTIGKEFLFRKTPLDLPIFCLISLALVSRFFSIYPHVSNLALYRLAVYAMLYYIIINNVKSIPSLERVSFYLVGIGGLLAIIGLLRYLGIKSLLSLWPHGAFSTYTSDGYFLAYIGMVTPLGLAILLSNLKPVKRIYLILASVLFIAVEILCNDKGSWIQFGSVLIFLAIFLRYMGLLKKRLLIIFLIAVLFAWGLSVYGWENIYKVISPLLKLDYARSSDQPIWTRLVYWKDTLKIIKEYPFFGSGIGAFQFVYPRFRSPQQPFLLNFAHQDFLQLASEIGLFGFAAFLWLVIKFFKFGFNSCKAQQQTLLKSIIIGSCSGCFGLLVYSLYDFNLHIPANAILFVTLIAIAVSSSLILKQTDTSIKVAPYYLFISLAVISLGALVIKFSLSNIHYEKGLAYENELSFDKAIFEYEKAISLNPGNSLYYSRLGNIYKIRSQFAITDKDYSVLAVKMFKKAQRLNPYSADHHIELADMYSREGLPEMALEEYGKAISLDPNNFYYHKLLALFYMKQQDRHKALSEVKIVLTLKPDDALANDLLGILKN